MGCNFSSPVVPKAANIPNVTPQDNPNQISGLKLEEGNQMKKDGPPIEAIPPKFIGSPIKSEFSVDPHKTEAASISKHREEKSKSLNSSRSQMKHEDLSKVDHQLQSKNRFQTKPKLSRFHKETFPDIHRLEKVNKDLQFSYNLANQKLAPLRPPEEGKQTIHFRPTEELKRDGLHLNLSQDASDVPKANRPKRGFTTEGSREKGKPRSKDSLTPVNHSHQPHMSFGFYPKRTFEHVDTLGNVSISAGSYRSLHLLPLAYGTPQSKKNGTGPSKYNLSFDKHSSGHLAIIDNSHHFNRDSPVTNNIGSRYSLQSGLQPLKKDPSIKKSRFMDQKQSISIDEGPGFKKSQSLLKVASLKRHDHSPTPSQDGKSKQVKEHMDFVRSFSGLPGFNQGLNSKNSMQQSYFHEANISHAVELSSPDAKRRRNLFSSKKADLLSMVKSKQ